jgi:hypothetical protein
MDRIADRIAWIKNRLRELNVGIGSALNSGEMKFLNAELDRLVEEEAEDKVDSYFNGEDYED